MDFEGRARGLRPLGYRGGITLEQGKHTDERRATVKRLVERMKGYLHA